MELKHNNVILKQSNEEKTLKLQQLQMEVTLLKEQNEELVKNVSDMNVNISEMHHKYLSLAVVFD